MAAGGGVEMRIDFGYGGRFRAGYWTPVRVVLTGTGLTRGQEEVVLDVTVRHGSPLATLSHTTTYRRTVRIPAGASVHTELYPLLSNAFHPLHIELRNKEGHLLTATTLDLARRAVPEGLVLALDPSGQEWAWFIQHLAGIGISRGQLSGPTLSYIERPQSLPSSWLGYHGVTAVAVSGAFPLRALSVAQAQALADWVAAGGTLILAGGADTEAIFASGVLGEVYAPFGLTGTTRRLPSDAVPTRYPAFPAEADLIVWESRPVGASVLSGAADQPLVVQAIYGKGTVFLISFDPASLDRLGWQGLGDVARDTTRTARPMRSGLHGAESAIWSFIRFARLPLPSRWVPGLLTLSYVAILALALWWVNRKGPRPAAAGVTLLAIVCLFSVATVRVLGPMAERARHGAAELTITMADASGYGERWTFHGLRSESSPIWRVQQAAAGWTQAPTQLISMDTADPDLNLVHMEQGILEVHLPPRTVGRFVAVSPTQVELDTRLTLRQLEYSLVVRNGTPHPIKHLYYVNPSIFAYLGPLPVGEAMEYAYPAGILTTRRPGAQWMSNAVANDFERRLGVEAVPQLRQLLESLVWQRLQIGSDDRPIDDGFLIGVVASESELDFEPAAAVQATHLLLFDVVLSGSSVL